jgi:peptide/nickel transport system substrate-binding protein
MKRIIVLLITVVLLISVSVTVVAQEPGSGEPIIQGNPGTSVGPLNVLRCSDTGCFAVARWLVVPFLGIDYATHYYAPDVDGVLVKDWTISDDGLTYTFNLNDYRMWSDGEPVDGFDFLFAYYAYKHAGEFESPFSYAVNDIDTVMVSDDGYTVTITFTSTACGVLGDAALFLVPSHVFGWTPELGEDFDWPSLIGHPYETEPTVSGGPFVFQSRDSERVVLVANENYYKPVIPEGVIYASVPDQTVMVDRLIAGELNVAEGVQPAKMAEIRANENLQTFDYPGNSWDFLALNLADPDNPVDGFEVDENGNPVLDTNGLPVPVVQPLHPLFGDVRVRRAIQLAIDVNEIMEKTVFGEGTIMASSQVPSSWAFDPDLEPIGYDPGAAVALLEEAGWTDTNGDGVLDKNGVKFSFELLTNQGNTRREQIIELVQQNLAEIGIDVEVSSVDFNQLLAIVDGQTFDAYVLGWLNPYPDNLEEWQAYFSTGFDVVGSGFNNVSYSNPDVDRLFEEARHIPGCKQEDRAPLYYEIQRILQDEQAYIWLFARNGMYAASKNITNWNPQANNMFYQAEEWLIE